MPRSLLPLFALLPVLALAVRADDLDQTTRDFDQVHLDLALELDLDRGEVLGRATWTLVPLVDGFRVLRLHCQDMEIRAVSGAHRFRAADGILEVELQAARARGEAFEVAIEYLARPRAGLYFFAPTADHPAIPVQVWSQGEGTDNRRWIPCYDLPDDRFTWRITVDAPAGLEVFGNGRRSEDGRTHVMDQPQVSYLITLVVGTFETVEETVGDLPLTYHVPPGRAADVGRAFGRTAEMIDFFGRATGRPYPYSIYRQIVVHDFMYGGMENTTATTLNARVLHDERAHGVYRADYLVAHELAHMWFGDHITCRTFDHLWLNEGFATYFTDLWAEAHFGRTHFLVRRRESAASWVGDSTPEGRGRLVKKGDLVPIEMPSFNYRKGSSVLHLLRTVLGDDVFADGIGRYVAACGGRSVETVDFQEAMEAAAGEDLDWLFDPWVYRAGFPEFAVDWTWRPTAGQAVVRVRQVQELEKHVGLFRVPVTLAFTIAGDEPTTVRRTVWIEEAEHEFVVDLPAAPDVVRFDEGDAIPKKVTFEKSVAERSRQLALDPDPTGRIEAAGRLSGQGLEAASALAAALAVEAEPEVRIAIARALATPPSQASNGGASASALRAALGADDDPRVRLAAATSLAAFAGDETTAALRRAIGEDASDHVAGAAAASLGRTAGAPATPELVALLERSSYADVVRVGAIDGLVAAAGEGALPHLVRFADYRWGAGGQHRLARHALEQAVAVAGADHPEVARLLVARLADPYFRTRLLAADLLARHGRVEAVGAILDAIDGERLEGVADGFEGALRRLAEVAARREADPLADRPPAELRRMLGRAREAADGARRRAEAAARWAELLEAAAGSGERR